MTGTAAELSWPTPLDDPYPALAELRERGPVHPLPGFDAHLVVSHAAVTDVLQGAAWSSDPANSPALAARLGMAQTTARSLLFSDPPEHARLRRALRGHLTPRAVEALRPRIRAIVSAAVAAHDPADPLEVMDDLAYPVPLAVMCELFGIPAEMAQLLRDETPRMVEMLDPLAPPEAVETGASSTFAVMLELVPLVAERRNRPGDDLLSALAHGGATDDLEVDEAITMALLLLAAGHETTANLVGNAVVALHDHPDVTGHLRERPELVPRALEELLRFDSPVQLTSRIATEDTSVQDVTITGGDQVLLSLGAANRDPKVFPNPERFDLWRDGRGNLAFGHGPHFCAGASLARCEADEMLSRLLDLQPPFEERDLTVERGSSVTFRRIKSLLIAT